VQRVHKTFYRLSTKCRGPTHLSVRSQGENKFTGGLQGADVPEKKSWVLPVCSSPTKNVSLPPQCAENPERIHMFYETLYQLVKQFPTVDAAFLSTKGEMYIPLFK